jgi:hypothetical protein
VGTTADQARAQVAATRSRVDSTLDRIELRLRQELDPKRRLRRDGPRIAVAVGVVGIVGTVYLMRQRRRRAADPQPRDWMETMPEEWRLRMQELLAEAAGHADQSGQRTGSKRSRGLAQSLALRAGKMALPVVLNALAERLAGHQTADPG